MMLMLHGFHLLPARWSSPVTQDAMSADAPVQIVGRFLLPFHSRCVPATFLL